MNKTEKLLFCNDNNNNYYNKKIVFFKEISFTLVNELNTNANSNKE